MKLAYRIAAGILAVASIVGMISMKDPVWGVGLMGAIMLWTMTMEEFEYNSKVHSIRPTTNQQ